MTSSDGVHVTKKVRLSADLLKMKPTSAVLLLSRECVILAGHGHTAAASLAVFNRSADSNCWDQQLVPGISKVLLNRDRFTLVKKTADDGFIGYKLAPSSGTLVQVWTDSSRCCEDKLLQLVSRDVRLCWGCRSVMRLLLKEEDGSRKKDAVAARAEVQWMYRSLPEGCSVQKTKGVVTAPFDSVYSRRGFRLH